MKTLNVLWKLINTLLLITLLIIGIIILRKVTNCCDSNEDKSPQEKVLILRTVEFCDSLTHKKGTRVWIDTLTYGQQGNSSIVIWNDCPEKETKKPVKISKSPVIKKTKETAQQVVSVKEIEEPIKKDTCILAKEPNVNPLDTTLSKESLMILYNNFINKDKDFSSLIPDTLRIKLERFSSKINSNLKTTTLLYSKEVALPTRFDGISNKTEVKYEIPTDLHIKEYIERAKRHLWVGTALASVGALGYAGTWFNEIPTFVEYNGLGAFDPANKYYDHNFHERERLRTLKWVRGVSIGVGVLGGIEVVHGIILLKNADVTLSPQEISLKYSF